MKPRILPGENRSMAKPSVIFINIRIGTGYTRKWHTDDKLTPKQKTQLPDFQAIGSIDGRDDWIRTSDLVVPNDARYRAALHPAFLFLSARQGVYPNLPGSTLKYTAAEPSGATQGI